MHSQGVRGTVPLYLLGNSQADRAVSYESQSSGHLETCSWQAEAREGVGHSRQQLCHPCSSYLPTPSPKSLTNGSLYLHLHMRQHAFSDVFHCSHFNLLTPAFGNTFGFSTNSHLVGSTSRTMDLLVCVLASWPLKPTSTACRR